MHRNSDKPNVENAELRLYNVKNAELRLYMDESGGPDHGTPHATLGGLLIFRNAFMPFEDAWEQMLVNHGIPDGIHMRKLGKPNGKLRALSERCRCELFDEACHLIRKYRAVTLVASLSNQEYEENIPELVRKSFSVYGVLFNLAVMMNHKLAEANNYHDPIPIIMDSGNSYKGHVMKAHEFMLRRWQRIIGDLHLGSLTFDDDKVLGILQAADIIAWGTRRRVTQLRFPAGLEPLHELLTSDELHHTEISWKPEWLREFGTNLAQRIADGQEFRKPTDEEIRES